jgi:hypothetical protein
MEQATVFSDSPVAMAAHWVDEGARRLHLVDLNGAFAGKPKNGAAVQGDARSRFRRSFRCRSAAASARARPCELPRRGLC